MSFTPWSHSKTSTHLSSARPSAQVASAVVSPPLAPLTSVACFPDPQNTGQTRRGSSRFSQIRSRGQLWLCHCAPSSSQRAAVARNDGGELSHGGGSLRTQRSQAFCGGTGPGGAETFVGPAPRARPRTSSTQRVKFVAQPPSSVPTACEPPVNPNRRGWLLFKASAMRAASAS